MATAANTSVRERRRRSLAINIEQMDIMKALTAAEYSRRQFVLNFAASRDTRLLAPGQKADKTKAAEEWVVEWMNQKGYNTITNDHFRYAVDERLWASLVGTDIPFPFSFMRQIPQVVLTVSSTEEMAPLQRTQSTASDLKQRCPRPKSEAFLPDPSAVEVRLLQDTAALPAPFAPPPNKEGRLSRTTTNTSTRSSLPLSTQPTEPRSPPAPAPTTQRRESLMGSRKKKKSSKNGTGTGPPIKPNPAVMSVPLMEKKRSLSLTSLEDLKLSKRASTQERFPFLVRWSRSWGRRA